jgi:hypothetical protein
MSSILYICAQYSALLLLPHYRSNMCSKFGGPTISTAFFIRYYVEENSLSIVMLDFRHNVWKCLLELC